MTRLTDLREGADAVALSTFLETLSIRTEEAQRVARILRHVDRIVEISAGARVAVVGCGPQPDMIACLRDKGFDAFGVEPVESFVRHACSRLNDPLAVLLGGAEALPVKDSSLELVFFENVLEHVESPIRCLSEIYRVLKPGGVAFVTTTNRLRFSFSGHTGEFNVPFINWFPRLLQESYVHAQLHQRPDLANMTLRPAVHWFTFSELCRIGREAGFARFYSTLDTRTVEDTPPGSGFLRQGVLGSKGLLRLIKQNPLVRSLALTQVGHDIMMWKRSHG
jgi:ubiquinone/menaquinone biosynthesis C-methylase UbiE